MKILTPEKDNAQNFNRKIFSRNNTRKISRTEGQNSSNWKSSQSAQLNKLKELRNCQNQEKKKTYKIPKKKK